MSATYFPLAGIPAEQWGTTVVTLQGTVADTPQRADYAPFIRFTLAIEGGSLIVQGPPELVRMPLTNPRPFTPTPTLEPTPTPTPEPGPPTDQISPWISPWADLQVGDQVTVTGIFDGMTGTVTAERIDLMAPPPPGVPTTLYRTLLHETELRPEMAPIYQGMEVWIITTIGNVPALTSEITADNLAAYPPEQACLLHGTLTFDGANFWVTGAEVIVQDAPWTYTIIYPPSP